MSQAGAYLCLCFVLIIYLFSHSLYYPLNDKTWSQRESTGVKELPLHVVNQSSISGTIYKPQRISKYYSST